MNTLKAAYEKELNDKAKGEKHADTIAAKKKYDDQVVKYNGAKSKYDKEVSDKAEWEEKNKQH